MVAADAAATAAVLYQHAPAFSIYSFESLQEAVGWKGGAGSQMTWSEAASAAVHTVMDEAEAVCTLVGHGECADSRAQLRHATRNESHRDVEWVQEVPSSMSAVAPGETPDGAHADALARDAHVATRGRCWVCRPRRLAVARRGQESAAADADGHAAVMGGEGLSPLARADGGGAGESERGRGVPVSAGDDGGSRESYVMPRLYGLLGNILFQTAAALVLAWELDALRFNGRRWRVLLPSARDETQCAKTYQSSLLSSPHLTRRPLASVAPSIRDWLYLDEGECHICYTDMLAAARRAAPGASLLVRGWRQSARYFAGGVGDMTHQERLVEAFSLPWHLEAAAEARMRQIILGREELETASLHVRRGDLVAEHGAMLTLDYYARAVERVGRDKLFVVFSDDVAWCQAQALFATLPHVVFVQVGVDYLELRLMSMCDHHIIANSTFSWWGACLHRCLLAVLTLCNLIAVLTLLLHHQGGAPSSTGRRAGGGSNVAELRVPSMALRPSSMRLRLIHKTLLEVSALGMGLRRGGGLLCARRPGGAGTILWLGVRWGRARCIRPNGFACQTASLPDAASKLQQRRRFSSCIRPSETGVSFRRSCTCAGTSKMVIS